MLELKCNNTAYRPVMDAIDLLQRYLDQPLKEGAFFDPAESVPLAGVLREGFLRQPGPDLVCDVELGHSHGVGLSFMKRS
ncbi:hypothetical protein [Streptomyces mirabilis]|uniref:hypothetical protein n=1 Tax=Streptomyces mirabilis TaxID=68239 RepID=UPI0036AD7363